MNFKKKDEKENAKSVNNQNERKSKKQTKQNKDTNIIQSNKNVRINHPTVSSIKCTKSHPKKIVK